MNKQSLLTKDVARTSINWTDITITRILDDVRDGCHMLYFENPVTLFNDIQATSIEYGKLYENEYGIVEGDFDNQTFYITIQNLFETAIKFDDHGLSKILTNDEHLKYFPRQNNPAEMYLYNICTFEVRNGRIECYNTVGSAMYNFTYDDDRWLQNNPVGGINHIWCSKTQPYWGYATDPSDPKYQQWWDQIADIVSESS